MEGITLMDGENAPDDHTNTCPTICLKKTQLEGLLAYQGNIRCNYLVNRYYKRFPWQKGKRLPMLPWQFPLRLLQGVHVLD